MQGWSVIEEIFGFWLPALVRMIFSLVLTRALLNQELGTVCLKTKRLPKELKGTLNVFRQFQNIHSNEDPKVSKYYHEHVNIVQNSKQQS